MGIIEINQKQIFFNDTGRGMPVVLLHNGFYSSKTWDGVRPRLAGRFRVIDYDRVGYGNSSPFTGSEKDEDFVSTGVDELESLMDTLQIDVCHLVGHCLGGAVALLYAGRHPDRVDRVVAASVGYFGDLKSVVKTDLTFVPLSQVPPALKGQMAAMHKEAYLGTFWSVLSNNHVTYIATESYDIRPTVEKLSCPILMINGDRDYYFDVDHPYGVYKKIQKNASLWIVPNCGHDVHHKYPEEFARQVAAFLEPQGQRG
jgi:pimeloyl-ACP methyl ester carboxylesterase